MTESNIGLGVESIHKQLASQYGLFMTANEVTDVLRLRSKDALRMACRRGSIDLSPVHPKERPLKFSTSAVAQLVANRLSVGSGLDTEFNDRKNPEFLINNKK